MPQRRLDLIGLGLWQRHSVWLRNEYIILRGSGYSIDRRTVGQWCDWYFANLGRNVSRRYVNDVVFHSSGRISIRFNYSAWSCYGVGLPGGTVEVQRNGFVIDRDRLF